MNAIRQKHFNISFKKSSVIGDFGGEVAIKCTDDCVNFRVNSSAQAAKISKCVNSISREYIKEFDKLLLSVYQLTQENCDLRDKLDAAYSDLYDAKNAK